MKKIKNIVIMIICIILIANQYSVVNATGIRKTLAMNITPQEQDMWCWASTSQTIIRWVASRNPTQAQIVTNIKGSPVNEGATYEEDSLSLHAWGVSNWTKVGTLSYSYIVSEINSNRPIKVSVLWQGGGGAGHDYVISGYDNTDPNNLQVIYLDPLDGVEKNLNYNSFVSNNLFYWKYSYYMLLKWYTV